MPGRHADPSRSSLRSDLFRFLVLLVILAVLLIGGVSLLIRLVNSGDADAVAATSSSTVTVASTTRPTTTTTTTTTQATTTTTTQATTTTTAAAATTTTTQATTTTTAVALDPSEVTLLVLNSTSRSGLAARLTARFDELGYQTLEPTNYTPALDTSRVWYVDGFALEAAAVAELVPDAIVELYPGQSPQAAITVVLGASFTE